MSRDFRHLKTTNHWRKRYSLLRREAALQKSQNGPQDISILASFRRAMLSWWSGTSLTSAG